MKKILLTLAILILPTLLFAEAKPKLAGRTMPDPRTYSSEAVYISSCTCAEGPNLKISTHSALLYAVHITTISAAGGILGVYDSRDTASGRMLTSSITTTAQNSRIFNVGASSGITAANVGGACLTFNYMELH